MTPDHALDVLTCLSTGGEWRNPQFGSTEYQRVGRAFRRLRKLFQAVVGVRGDPFEKLRRESIPKFQIRLHPNLGRQLMAAAWERY